MNNQETFNVLFCANLWSWFSSSWTICCLTWNWSKSHMIGLMGLPVDKVNYQVVCTNIRILATQALCFVCDEICTIIDTIMILFKLFSYNIPVQKYLPPNLNKSFTKPPCRLTFEYKNSSHDPTIYLFVCLFVCFCFFVSDTFAEDVCSIMTLKIT